MTEIQIDSYIRKQIFEGAENESVFLWGHTANRKKYSNERIVSDCNVH